MPMPAHIKRLIPSLNWEGPPADDAKVTLSLGELRALIEALTSAEVDEAWYLRQYPDVREGIARGVHPSAAQHYRSSGFFEGRLPADPPVDEEWYRATNPDVAAGVRQGKFRSAKEHYIQCGYLEGRAPQPEALPARPGLPPVAARFVPRPRF